MKTVRLYAPGDLRYQDEPDPIANNGEKLVRVRAVGVSGSDLLWFSEGEISDAKLERPLVLGHEFAGEMEDGQRVAIDPASKLSIKYKSFSGDLDYYDLEANKVEGLLELILDEVITDLTYPVASPIDGLIQDAGVSITALSENVISLLDVQRTDAGFQFTWQNFNPTKFPLKTHIGTPPVIGVDGIFYGFYESMDIVPIPITPANEKMEWTTEVAVPKDVKGFYILLSVESKKPRTYVNYAVDITDR